MFVGSVQPDDQITTPTMFLTGKGNLVRDFSSSFVEPAAGMPPGTRALKLVPKTPQRDYDWLILEIARETLELRGLVTVDAQEGNRRFPSRICRKTLDYPIRISPSRCPAGLMLSLAHRPDSTTVKQLSATIALVLVCLTLSGCAAATALNRGRDAERRQDYDLAVVEASKASRLKPDSVDARTALERAKLRASEHHYERGRRLAATGKLEEALVEYELAIQLNPTSSAVEEELRSTRNQLRTKVAVSRDGKTELQTLIERTREMPPPGLDLPTDVRMPTSVVFRDASSREVYLAIARFANISLTFDPTFRETPITVDLRNASLDDALNAVSGATRTFFRSPHRALSPSSQTRQQSVRSTRRKSSERST